MRSKLSIARSNKNLAADSGNKEDLWERCLSGVPLPSFSPLFCTFMPLELTRRRGIEAVRI